jgi:general secretion pathway protein C
MQFPKNITVFSAFTLVKSKKIQKQASQLILLILVVYIAYIAAQITWFALPNVASSNVVMQKNNTVSVQAVQKNIDISALQKLNLFGEFNKQAIEIVEVENAPETRLNLTLSGLAASDDPDKAAAIIEYQGKQETYGIDELIEGTKASLAQVLMDRVLIKYSGRLETLMLDGFDYKEPARSMKKPTRRNQNAIVDHSGNAELITMVKEFKHDVTENPSKISDYLKIQPKGKNGEVVGYSLQPGRKPEFFKQTGLKSGDIAIQVNGYNLKEPSEAMQALTEMREASDMSLLIERRGELIEIRFSLN